MCMRAYIRVASLTELSMSAGVHQDGLTREPTQPCQCYSIRLGPNAKPNEMAVLNTLANTPYCSTTVTIAKSEPLGLASELVSIIIKLKFY